MMSKHRDHSHRDNRGSDGNGSDSEVDVNVHPNRHFDWDRGMTPAPTPIAVGFNPTRVGPAFDAGSRAVSGHIEHGLTEQQRFEMDQGRLRQELQEMQERQAEIEWRAREESRYMEALRPREAPGQRTLERGLERTVTFAAPGFVST